MNTPSPSFGRASPGGQSRRQRFGDTLFEWIHRYLFHVVIAGAVLFYVVSSMRPQILFTSEGERIDFVRSIGVMQPSRVIVLVTEWCPACKSLEAGLRAQGLSFIRVDIEKSLAGRELFSKAADISGSNAIPKVIVDRNLVGHSLGAISAALRESPGS